MGSFVVTGASSGIGAAVAAELDRLGHDVYAGVRSEAAAGSLAERSSRRVVPLRLDVTDAAQVAEATEQVRSGVGRYGLDGLVNNAGIALGGPVEFLPLDEWREQFEVNVLGQVAVTQALIPSLRVSRGRIVFIGSVAGMVSSPFGAPYGASKHAIAAVAQSLRAELAPWALDVSLVEPGAVGTAIWEKGAGTVERVKALVGEEALDLYGPAIERLDGEIAKLAGSAPGPEKVVAAVTHALFDPRPRPRYAAGWDARAVALGVRLLPERVLTRLLERQAG